MYKSSSTKRGFRGSGPLTNRPFYSSANRKRNVGRKKMGENIDISRFIQKSSEMKEVNEVFIKHTFSDFSFSESLKDNLKKKNYIVPTPIQDQAIKPILEGRDVVGLANTGTGKTAAFLLPLIDKVHRNRSEKVLIITPTRELAVQIENELRQFSYGMKIFFASCVGGMSIYNQITNLKRKPNFVIGTPGRLKDLNQRRILDISSFNNIVLDEVDRMLDMGFINEIKQFLSMLPKNRQSLFFSATMPVKIRDLVHGFLNNPVTVEVKSGETTANVDQDIVRVPERHLKFNKLEEVLAKPEVSKVLIFSETKRDVEKLTVDLQKRGYKAESIHGDKRQGQRQRALRLFQENSVGILVATDVAARGLDIKNVSHVINYTVPQTYDDYVHRIGRTGRAGKKGKALTFVEAR